MSNKVYLFERVFDFQLREYSDGWKTRIMRDEWGKEWHGMPEFVQEKQRPHAKIIVRIDNAQDLALFSELIGQKLTEKTKSVWFPCKEHRERGRWKNESEVSGLHSVQGSVAEPPDEQGA